MIEKVAKWFFIAVVWVWVIVLFGSAFLCFSLSFLGIHTVSSKIRFPLGLPGAIAVDSKGRVYCTLQWYRRLQVYDNEGQFIRGWFVSIPANFPIIEVDENDHIHVETAASKGYYAIFSSDGVLLEKRSKDFYEKKWSGFLETKDDAGNIYRIKDAWFFPKIVKISPSGKEAVVISDPFYLWLMKAPFPTGAFILAAMAIGGIMELREWIKRKKRKANPTAEATRVNSSLTIK